VRDRRVKPSRSPARRADPGLHLFACLLAVVTLRFERVEELLAIDEYMSRAVASERDPRGVRKGAPDLVIGERGHKDEG
jgi:hypothetical protein